MREIHGSAKLRQWLTENKWTYKRLAEKLGVKLQTISNWTNGWGRPNLENILQLQAMGITAPEDWTQ